MDAATQTSRPASNPNNVPMTEQTFGIEIETFMRGATGRGKGARTLAHRIADQMGWSVTEGTDYYRTCKLHMPDGRTWSVLTDNSVTGGNYGSAEIVSPIMRWEDMELVQAVVRAARKAGAKIDKSCGIHVHVGGDGFRANPRKLVNLVKLVEKREGLIFDMVAPTREQGTWCKPVAPTFAAALKALRQPTLTAIDLAWYGDTHTSRRAVGDRYNCSRYKGLNLHSFFNGHGTIEFRYFTATLHAGKVRAFICLALALVGKALAARSIGKSSARTGTRGAYQVLYFELGLSGAYFDTLRTHLLDNVRKAGTCRATAAASARAVRTNGNRNAARAVYGPQLSAVAA